jgi:small redox-active disulfide protein 2
MSAIKIEIFSSRCAKCRILEVQVKRAVAEMGLDAEILMVHNLEAARSRGIQAMPGLALNGEVVSMGAVPDEKELRAMLRDRS